MVAVVQSVIDWGSKVVYSVLKSDNKPLHISVVVSSSFAADRFAATCARVIADPGGSHRGSPCAVLCSRALYPAPCLKM